MGRNKSTFFWIGGLLVVLIVLFLIPRINDPYREQKARWREADVECLNQGHTQLALHIHPVLKIFVDDREETIPAEIGIVSNCMAEVHTHDESGTLHLESRVAGKSFILGQFFAVWGQPLERDGYQMKVTADGELVENPSNLILKDLQQIVIEYQSLSN